MCWTSRILAGCTLLAPEPAPELTPCKAGEPGLGTGTRLSLASKTRYFPLFLLVSSGFYVLCKVLMINIDRRCHPEMWNLFEGKKNMIIKEKLIYFLQVLLQKLCKEEAGKTLHYFLKVSWWLV